MDLPGHSWQRTVSLSPSLPPSLLPSLTHSRPPSLTHSLTASLPHECIIIISHSYIERFVSVLSDGMESGEVWVRAVAISAVWALTHNSAKVNPLYIYYVFTIHSLPLDKEGHETSRATGEVGAPPCLPLSPADQSSFCQWQTAPLTSSQPLPLSANKSISMSPLSTQPSITPSISPSLSPSLPLSLPPSLSPSLAYSLVLTTKNT